MTTYAAPLKDVFFSLYDVNNYDEHYKGYELTKDLVTAIVEQAAKFSERELFPLNASGDAEGVRLVDGEVKVPGGFKQAFQRYIDGGWPTLSQPLEFGGQGLPHSVATIVTEFWQSANQAWSMYPFLGEGACETLLAYGGSKLKSTFLPNLVSGKWTGTMCLTEPQAGSDLGLLRTKAVPIGGDSDKYSITGSKIFISSGDHDISENIIHLVLARLPNSPAGSRGISLFIVPKFKVSEDGGIAERNSVVCGSIEHKMGLNGSATCQMNFDNAEGYLIGPVNKGLSCMFTFINKSRLGTAVQGQAQTEGAYQMSVNYAQDRLQGRCSGSGEVVDPIVNHPDVKRMLLTQRAFSEGGRTLTHYCAKLVDCGSSSDINVSNKSKTRLSLLIPIAKGCLTEWGFEAADLGIQIFGGHGYIRESGIEQRLRDVRVSRLYEGTTGIQAQDFIMRKVVADGGVALDEYINEVMSFLSANDGVDGFSECRDKLKACVSDWQNVSHDLIAIVDNANSIYEEVAFDYLMYSGYVVLAYQWAQICVASLYYLNHKDCRDREYYMDKLETKTFFFHRILPRSLANLACINAVIEGNAIVKRN
ncbi:acyl-CoA dehydrogenase family protein [Zhongshania aquimaris]|uniref:Acyl-CoA dehydrogenase family protein n=1 Tax=Zhongshania aquimaris TaxID=2857107 RepID=A0ABS6VV13_9GAMM|nr:acyl-CoA dehydrogenase family protein [Zhongshania aquimaris]MBW2942169.1 acyl-CoA dehydrogenase family protein [Zhongshania aquimaris]